MKRLASASLALLAVLILTGCGYTLSEVAAARDECHAYGGEFRSWMVPEFDDSAPYNHTCDLSDEVEK